METQNVKWSVSLSDGQTLYENKGEYQIIAGEDSPWQRLLKHLEKEEKKITSLSLYMDNGKRWNLPSAGRNPKFKIFCDAEQPDSYKFFRKIGMDMDGSGVRSNQEIFSVIEAIYKDKKLQVWVSEDNPDNCWSVIV